MKAGNISGRVGLLLMAGTIWPAAPASAAALHPEPLTAFPSRSMAQHPEPGQALWSASNPAHSIENVGETPLCVIAIELKDANR